jgi:hypothetical protein
MMPKEEFRREVDRYLTGKETEPWELLYFKVYKSQLPIIERALETATLMLGSDKSRGHCLEMICADFLAGAHLDDVRRHFINFTEDTDRVSYSGEEGRSAAETPRHDVRGMKEARIILDEKSYRELWRYVLERDGWRCQSCGNPRNLQVHHIRWRSKLGGDCEENLITLCANCCFDQQITPASSIETSPLSPLAA